MPPSSATSVCAFTFCLLLAACGKRDDVVRADPVAPPVRHDSFVDLEPGRRIGPIRIGMRREQVIGILGTPTSEDDNSNVVHLRRLSFEQAHLEVVTERDVVIVLRALPGWAGRVTASLRFDSTVDELRAVLGKPRRESIYATLPGYRALEYGGLEFQYWMVKGLPRCDGGTICADEVPVLIEVRRPPAAADADAP